MTLLSRHLKDKPKRRKQEQGQSNKHANQTLKSNKDQVNKNQLSKSNTDMVKVEAVTPVVVEEDIAVVAEVATKEVITKKKVDIEVGSTNKRAIIRKKVAIEVATKSNSIKKKVKEINKKVIQVTDEEEVPTEVVGAAEVQLEVEVAMEAMKANNKSIDQRINQ